jgi:hypothetical protein
LQLRWIFKYKCYIKISAAPSLNFLEYKFVNAPVTEVL